MLMRRIISTILAVVFVFVAAIAPAFADGTPPAGGSGDKEIHPWDINDGVTPGTGSDDAVAPTLSTVVFYPGWYSDIIGTALMIHSMTRTVTSEARIDSPVSVSKASSSPSQNRNVRR